MIKKVLFVFSLFILPNLLFAHGKGDIDERPIEQMDSWQEDFDINNKKAGKYNILVTVEDQGGNESIGGPYNIFIDPDSDYTISGITNPIKNMRVPGNLNIVGTCIDDDGVEEVYLVLDGAEPVKAEGKEFWSYYLDTTQLAEGPHTIEVYGVDINGLSSVDKPKKKAKVLWNLDRRKPVTEVTNIGLGTLVSGKIELKGTIYDGNGIKSLSYSLDGGKNFFDVKIDENKKTGNWDFSLPIDTRESEDGAAVCWFKATDNMGSVGLNSFLYFIDNTKPDVRIVSPAKDEVMNGKFGVAGYAKDEIGVEKLSWSFNGQTGEFELVPGNPYWYKEIDTTGLTKNTEFVITAIDTVGNQVVVKREIPLNQEADKPVVTIESPSANGIYEGSAGTLFLRGIVADDDGVASIEYSLDGGESQVMEVQGVFYAPLSVDSDLPAGKHTVSVVATDIYGVKGNPVITTFISKGKAPAFADANLKSSLGVVPVVQGLEVHPESNPTLETIVSADCGISKVSYKLEWGESGLTEKQIELKSAESSVPVVIPLSDTSWGIVRLTICATDIYERVTEKKIVLKVKDLTKITTTEPRVVFDDSRVSESGDIINNIQYPVSGYFVGGTIKSASLVPDTNFAKLEYTDNTITLNATDAIGASSPVKVKIITDENVVYESRPLIFHSDSPAPVVYVEDNGANFCYDGFETVRVSGKISSATPLTSVSYRILSVPATMQGEYVLGAGTATIGQFEQLPAKTGDFSFEIPSEYFNYGMAVVEVVANNGKEGAGSLKVKKLPPLPEKSPDGKKAAVPAKPVITWLEGVDVYYLTTCQGDVDNLCGTFSRNEMAPGSPELSLTVKDSFGKIYTSKHVTKKEGTARVYFESVNDVKYASGMNVVVPYGAQSSAKLVATIVSDFPVSSVSYDIEGEKLPGGDEKQSGKVDAKSIRTVEAGIYQVDIPLRNLPSRITNVTVAAETVAGNASYKGTVSVIRERPLELIDNSRKIYWAPQADAKYDELNKRYVLATNTQFGAYANVLAPITASLVTPQEGLKVVAEGNYVYVIADQEGLFRNVAIKVMDKQGVEYRSNAVNLLIDNENPFVQIQTPTTHKWIQKNTRLSVEAKDVNGISGVEYSIDGRASWNTAQSVAPSVYAADLSLQVNLDGLIPIDVKVTDIAGKVSYTQTVIQKDTTPPVVQVVLPGAEDIVNGENLIAFIAKDENGRLSKAEYVAPKTGKEVKTVPVEIGPMVVTHVGTTEKPINDLMAFNFYDEVGNITSIRSWEFLIDANKDLPKAEVHLPEENAVITTDFSISGVILDDDGIKKDETGAIVAGPRIFYKIDNGEYKALPGVGTSFAIDIPLSSMTDNEHSVTVYAEDINGVKGPEFVRNFRVSLEEPKGAVVTPPISETVKGFVKLTGNATDKNGISKVFISVDNGNSYNEAIGNFSHEETVSNWSYEFDTRVIEDGTHVVFLKIVDWYGIEGLYSSLINIDNTAPSINLELPLDDSKTTKMLFFSGQTTDNIGLEELYITIRSLEGKIVSSKLAHIDLVPGEIITQSIDMTSLDDGFYNVELTGKDAAENITRVSRNIQLNKKAAAAKVDMLYPLNGEFVKGIFNIYGTAVSEVPVSNLELYVDGSKVSETELSDSGYYKFTLDPQLISDGQHKVQVRANLANATTILSNEQYVNYSCVGPWVTIDNFTYGDFAIERPYIVGNAGYAIAEDELIAAKTKGASKELKAMVDAKSVEKVELSLNNGKSFEEVSKTGKWRYRVENEDIAEGYHFLLVRATMKNGEVAVTRTIVQVDKTKPSIRLISPGEGGRYNQNLEFSGLASDDVALKSVTLALRKGDKASYEVPAFIQGLYFDWHFWGATLFDIGAGLSFFDDNVKLQVQWGQFTQEQRNQFSKTNMRYGGDSVFGGKILANVAYIPFRYFLGPDWEWLSANVAVGANFSRFNESTSGKAQILSAMLCQLEFPRITFAKQKMFRTIAFYTEGQLWFIPTDVNSEVEIENLVPQISVGLRVNVF